jgi:RNA polymerase sigma factor (sigma-70 family)
MEKSEFMQACAKGGAAFSGAATKLMRDFWNPLLRDAMRSVSSLELAKDMVQQTMIKAWQQCHTFRGDADLRAWLQAILRNGLIDHFRRVRPEESHLNENDEVRAEVEWALLADGSHDQLNPQAVAEAIQLMAIYQACFARFAAEHPQAANVIRWVAEDGLSNEQVAKILGRSPAATKEFISQSRKKARRYLADWYALVRPQQKQAA